MVLVLWCDPTADLSSVTSLSAFSLAAISSCICTCIIGVFKRLQSHLPCVYYVRSLCSDLLLAREKMIEEGEKKSSHSRGTHNSNSKSFDSILSQDSFYFQRLSDDGINNSVGERRNESRKSQNIRATSENGKSFNRYTQHKSSKIEKPIFERTVFPSSTVFIRYARLLMRCATLFASLRSQFSTFTRRNCVWWRILAN